MPAQIDGCPGPSVWLGTRVSGSGWTPVCFDCAYTLGALRGHAAAAVSIALVPSGALFPSRCCALASRRLRWHPRAHPVVSRSTHARTRMQAQPHTRPFGCTRSHTSTNTTRARAGSTVSSRTPNLEAPHVNRAARPLCKLTSRVSARSRSKDHWVCQSSAVHFRESRLSRVRCSCLVLASTIGPQCEGDPRSRFFVYPPCTIVASATKIVHSPGADAGRAQPAQRQL